MPVQKMLRAIKKGLVNTKARTIILSLIFIVLIPQSYLHCKEETSDIKVAAEEVKKGDALYGQRRLWDSLTYYKKAFSIKPDADLYFKIGMVYMNLSKTLLAEEFFLQAVELNKEYASAYKALGEIYVERWQIELAREAFHEAQLLFSKNGDMQEAILSKRLEEIVDYIVMGHKLQYVNKPQESIYYYELAAEHTIFKSPQVLYKLGIALKADNRYTEAIRELKAALSLRPEHRDARYDLALAYGACGKCEDAEVLLREVILMSPQWPDAHVEMARYLKEKDRSKSAEELYKAGILFLEQVKVDGEPARYLRVIANPLKAEKEVYKVGDLSMNTKGFKEARFCLEEIKHLCGKSSSLYKKLRREIYQKELSKIKIVEYQ